MQTNKTGSTQGFSLLELMIALVMVAILAAIAIPSYSKIIANGNRNLAKSYLLDIAAEQDKYRLQNRSYASNFVQLDKVASGTGKIYLDKGGKLSTTQTSDSLYELELAANATFCGAAFPQYISAIAVGTQATRDPDCRTFRVCYNGKKMAVNSGGTSNDQILSDCWD